MLANVQAPKFHISRDTQTRGDIDQLEREEHGYRNESQASNRSQGPGFQEPTDHRQQTIRQLAHQGPPDPKVRRPECPRFRTARGTEMAPTGSSICSLSQRRSPNTTITPAIAPIAMAANGGDRGTGGGDSHESGENTVERDRYVGFAKLDPGNDHSYGCARGRGYGGIYDDQRHGTRIAETERGTGVEAEPSKPENENTESRQRHAVAADNFGAPVLVEFTDPWAQHHRPDECGDPADAVDHRRSGKIVETEFGQPSTSPDPMANNRVNKR